MFNKAIKQTLAEALQKLRATGKAVAVDRSTAAIEFKPDVAIIGANENLLTTMGYRLEESSDSTIVFSVFLITEASADYRKFWQHLAGGSYTRERFLRRNKQGLEVWSKPAKPYPRRRWSRRRRAEAGHRHYYSGDP
jgi:methyl-accepting chemotaxis protein